MTLLNFNNNYFTFQAYQNVKMVCLKAFIIKMNFVWGNWKDIPSYFLQSTISLRLMDYMYSLWEAFLSNLRSTDSAIGPRIYQSWDTISSKTNQNPYGWAKLSSLLCHFGCLLLPENKCEINEQNFWKVYLITIINKS